MFSKPQFLVIGPYRTGTTWLYSQLCHVQGIQMPPYKELNFFFDADMNMQLAAFKKTGSLRPDMYGLKVTNAMIEDAIRGMQLSRKSSYRQAKEKAGWLWARYYNMIPRNFNWLSLYLYTRLFNNTGNDITGDVSPAYFTLSPGAIQKVYDNFPQTKIIITLRDPLEREWSNILTHHLAGNEKTPFSIHTYLQQADLQRDYKTAIENWERVFGSKNICYIFYDQLVESSEAFTKQILSFIDPACHIKQLLSYKVGESPNKKGDTPAIKDRIEIRRTIVEKNMPQYLFMAQKFGQVSYPAKWLELARYDY